jgi:hypothetical protein
MEWAQAREVLADEYVADVQSDKIAARRAARAAPEPH